MSRANKLKLMRVKEILERETDSEHGITMERILDLLAMYGIFAERKGIYADIGTLQDELGMDIERPSRQEREYRVLSREFDVSELRLMIDAIQADKFLPVSTADRLIHKIEKLCSRHEAYALQSTVYVSGRAKCPEDTSRNIGYIHEAILHNKQITFRYFDYTWEGKKRYRTEGGVKNLYVVSPYYLMYNDGRYYLLAYANGKSEMRTYRVDRMANVCLLEAEREGQDAAKKVDPAEYQKHTFNMFGGDIEKVSMVFENRLAGVAMDKFGYDVMMGYEDEGHFRVTVPVSVSQQFYGWVFGLGAGAKIVWPERVKLEYEEALRMSLQERV